MQRDFPPYRADHVGSLLRPLAVKQARSKYAAGQLSAAELKVIEDAEIKKIIARQEEIGLRSVTDGELRRAYWHSISWQDLTACRWSRRRELSSPVWHQRPRLHS
jgi:5-methyltetrahydropteroyltriglutamate--homocysteine methyltransferase